MGSWNLDGQQLPGKRKVANWRVYNMDRIHNGHADRQWLERCFHKLLINFASWVIKVNREGDNVFEGGALGLAALLSVALMSLPAGAQGSPEQRAAWTPRAVSAIFRKLTSRQVSCTMPAGSAQRLTTVLKCLWPMLL
jgi:hypothetical protein